MLLLIFLFSPIRFRTIRFNQIHNEGMDEITN